MSQRSRLQLLMERGNRLMEPVFNSPLVTRLLRVEPVHVRYTGRKSGRVIELPVWAKPTADGMRIRVGAASQKSWWRNFTGKPGPLEIMREGTWRSGQGLVERSPSGAVTVHVTGPDRTRGSELVSPSGAVTSQPPLPPEATHSSHAAA